MSYTDWDELKRREERRDRQQSAKQDEERAADHCDMSVEAYRQMRARRRQAGRKSSQQGDD